MFCGFMIYVSSMFQVRLVSFVYLYIRIHSETHLTFMRFYFVYVEQRNILNNVVIFEDTLSYDGVVSGIQLTNRNILELMRFKTSVRSFGVLHFMMKTLLVLTLMIQDCRQYAHSNLTFKYIHCSLTHEHKGVHMPL